MQTLPMTAVEPLEESLQRAPPHITPGRQSHELHHTAHYEKDHKLSF